MAEGPGHERVRIPGGSWRRGTRDRCRDRSVGGRQRDLEWTGDKLHPVQLGIITIALSLIAMAAVVFAHRIHDLAPVQVALAVAILFAAMRRP